MLSDRIVAHQPPSNRSQLSLPASRESRQIFNTRRVTEKYCDSRTMGVAIFFLMMLLSISISVRAIRLSNKRFLGPRIDITRLMNSEITQLPSNGDVLITGLNGPQDIMVKVVACREIMQETIIKNDLSPQSGKALGEVLVSTLMMGSGLKGEESLQVGMDYD